MPNAHRILIVDDAINARTALSALLRDEGFQVETTAGSVASSKLTRFAPHVVIIDLQLIGISAIELITRMRQAPSAPAVLVMTAFGETGPALEALRAGADHYVTKPISVDELLLVLGKATQHYDLEREVDELRRAHSDGQPRAVVR